MRTLVVAGALANRPRNGGEAWVRLSWLRGFAQLGFDTYLLEEIDPATCVDERGETCPIDDSANLAHFQEIVRQFGLEDHAALIVGDEHRFGLSLDRVRDIAEDASLLVNISGHLQRPDVLKRFERRAYVDIDPGYTQLWHASGADLGIEQHDVHFTIGENV